LPRPGGDHHRVERIMQLTGAEIVVRCLQEEGVEYVFGYPGGAVLNIYDELFKQEKVKHVLVRHEQGAAHAADGYSRASEKVGVCLVTSGPGVTNAVTGIATAYMDSIPMVVLTGQVPTHAIGQDAFQECDTVGITRPSGSRAGRHPKGRDAGESGVQLSEDDLAALL
jgi:acetolactate synthase I/II/III large subunit